MASDLDLDEMNKRAKALLEELYPGLTKEQIQQIQRNRLKWAEEPPLEAFSQKLKTIILDGVHDQGTWEVEGIDPETVDGVIPEIKQAFIDDGWVEIITGGCTHPDFKKRNCRFNHECEYCMFCGEERHMIVSERDAHDKPIPTMTEAEWEAKAIKDGWNKPSITKGSSISVRKNSQS